MKDDDKKIEGLPLPDGSSSAYLVGESDLILEPETLPENAFEKSDSEEIGIEYPNIPEISEMGSNAPPFISALVPNLKAIMTSNDLGKVEIFEDAFGDDPKWGGAYKDKFGLPMIVWNGLPYYVNKPGLSGTDVNTFLGQMVKYYPATKYASGAKGIVGTMIRGGFAYTGTEVAGEIAGQYFTPETQQAKNRTNPELALDIVEGTAIGVGADVLLPPVARLGAKAIGYMAKATGVDKLGRKLVEMTLPLFKPSVLAKADQVQESKYQLTQGQRTARLPEGVTPRQTEQLGVEDVLRQSASDETGTVIIRGFDDSQLNQIRNDALELQEEFGTGSPRMDQNMPQDAAERIQMIAEGRASQLKDEAGEAYDFVKNVASPPRMTREGVEAIAEDMLKVVRDMFAPSQLVDGPLLRETTQLKKLLKLAKDPRFKDQTLKNIHGYQKRLNTAIGQAGKGTPEETALIRMKKALDDSVYNGIKRGFIYGDQEVLDQLANATGLYRDFMRLTGKGGARNAQQRTANRILEQLSNNDFTPLQVTNLLFGHNKFNPNQAVPLVLSRLKKSLPKSEYDDVVALMKDAILTKAFTGKNGNVTRTAIVNNFNDVFVKQKKIIEQLFTSKEIAQIKQFRENVLPTLWSEIKLNPSGTGYTILGALARRQLLSTPMLRPVAEKVVQGYDASMRAGQAMDAIRQTLNRFQAPLISLEGQAILRPIYATEATTEGLDDLPDIVAPEEIEKGIDDFVMPERDEPVFDDAITGRITRPNIPMINNASMPINPAVSPTVLPNPQDRELAMRRSGLASLV